MEIDLQQLDDKDLYCSGVRSELKGSDTFTDDSGKDEHCRQQRRQ